MKAILEIDAPENCEQCRFYDETPIRNYCRVNGKDVNGYYYFRERAPSCPLKIIYPNPLQPVFDKFFQDVANICGVPVDVLMGTTLNKNNESEGE